MKRPIKFRGKREYNGELVYGSYVREVYSDIGTIHAIVDEGGEEFLVDENSVAQLVGYDANGAEVYEGDTLIDQFGFDSQAWLAKSFHDDCILKEATK